MKVVHRNFLLVMGVLFVLLAALFAWQLVVFLGDEDRHEGLDDARAVEEALPGQYNVT